MALEANGGRFYIDAALKAQQWERCKGELRALVALQGSYGNAVPKHMEKEPPKWERLKAAVEAFIVSIEDDGLQE